MCNSTLAEQEWRSHVDLPLEYFRCEQSEFYRMNVDTYWKKVFESKNGNGEPEFPNLKICISLLLCLPFSNASAVRVFSSMKNSSTQQVGRQKHCFFIES